MVTAQSTLAPGTAAGVDSKLLDWFIKGETGISSETMAAVLTGRTPARGHHNWPHDPGDFRRCVLLLDAIPELRQHLSKMADLSPEWAALVARWADIEQSLRNEIGPSLGKGEAAPNTYALMRSILILVELAQLKA